MYRICNPLTIWHHHTTGHLQNESSSSPNQCIQWYQHSMSFITNYPDKLFGKERVSNKPSSLLSSSFWIHDTARMHFRHKVVPTHFCFDEETRHHWQTVNERKAEINVLLPDGLRNWTELNWKLFLLLNTDSHCGLEKHRHRNSLSFTNQ